MKVKLGLASYETLDLIRKTFTGCLFSISESGSILHGVKLPLEPVLLFQSTSTQIIKGFIIYGPQQQIVEFVYFKTAKLLQPMDKFMIDISSYDLTINIRRNWKKEGF